MANTTLRTMQLEDWPAVAELVWTSTNSWYERAGRPPVFACKPADAELFCRVYEALDPGCCAIVEDIDSGRLLGSCFYHQRTTHTSLGIMNVHPDAFGRGVARQLLQFVIGFATERELPLRLISSAMNLDSFSLYNRAGFRPYQIFQDMTMRVPDGGLAIKPGGVERVRAATSGDIAAMVALERELCGIERERDYRYFLANDEGNWHVSALDDDTGKLCGFCASIRHPASNMIGPGVARTDAGAAALLAAELGRHRGESPVWLLPADRPSLLREAYSWGARNCELHFAQVLGDARAPSGVVLPTFMPETG